MAYSVRVYCASFPLICIVEANTKPLFLPFYRKVWKFRVIMKKRLVFFFTHGPLLFKQQH